MIYQVKKNTDDIEELKQENINLRNELNEIKREIYAQKGKIL